MKASGCIIISHTVNGRIFFLTGRKEPIIDARIQTRLMVTEHQNFPKDVFHVPKALYKCFSRCESVVTSIQNHAGPSHGGSSG